MFGSSPTTDRRAFLAAAPALALITAGPATALAKDDPISAAWDAAMSRFRAADAAEKSYDARLWLPAYEREDAFISSKMPCDLQVLRRDHPDEFLPEAVDAEMERLIDIRCNAEDALIETAAPRISDVIWKIEYARKRWSEFCDWPDDWWHGVMSDLRRLAA